MAILPPAWWTASVICRCFSACASFSSRRAGHHHAVLVGCDAAGHDQPDAATRALGIEGGEAGEALRRFFEAGVHRAHQDAILQRRKAEVERGEQVGIRVVACMLDGSPGTGCWRDWLVQVINGRKLSKQSLVGLSQITNL
jgi:hypothetical protein